MRFFVTFVFCLGLLLTGCKPNDSAPSTPGGAAGKSDLKARLDAAKAITFTSERDSALAAVARDAAKAGDAGVTKGAIGGIVFTSAKDEAAAESALRLAAAGQGTAANEVAQMITFTSVRDATLKKLATGGR